MLAAAVAALVAASNGAAATSTPLDTSFGSGGVSLVSVGGKSVFGNGGTVQPDGKAIVFGQIRPSSGAASTEDLMLARLNTDGSLDTSFGTSGVVTQDINGGADIVQTAVVDGSGDIVVGGSTDAGGSNANFFVGRFLPDGTLDTSFGTNGFYVNHFFSGTAFDEEVSGLAIQPGGKIVAVASTTESSGGFTLFRLNTDGTLDTSFAISGRHQVDLDPSTLGYSLAIDPDGGLFVGGEQDARMAAWRFDDDGFLDSSYGSSGLGVGVQAKAGTGDVAYGIVVQRGGAVVLAGGRGFTNTGSKSNEAFALERLGATGDVDTTFGAHGLTQVQVGAHDDEIESLQQSAGGKLVAVGYTATAETDSTFTPQLAAARFTADGVLDTTFGTGGKFVVAKGNYSLANGGGALPDGSFFGFGYSWSGGTYSAEAAEFTPPSKPTLAALPKIATAGDTVDLSGSGFTPSSTVKVGTLTIPGGDVTYVSSTELDVVLPDNAVTGKVTVTTGGVSLAATAPLKIKPRIDSIDGDIVAPAGTPFGIEGGGFTGVTSVKVGGVAFKVKVDSPTHLTVTAPTSAVAGLVTITNAGGTTTWDGGVIGVTAVVTSFSPASGRPGTTVTIKGSGLKNASVYFGVEGTVKSTSPTSIVVQVPNGAATGKIDVQIPNGQGLLTSSDFTVLPTITSVDVNINGGSVAIQGASLDGVTGVTFAGVTADYTPVSASRVNAVVPDGPATGKWVVTTTHGTATSAPYTVVPMITGISPGDAPPGATVTITGTGFASVKSVKFDAGSATASFRVLSTTEMTAVVPGGSTAAVGPGSVVISNVSGSSPYYTFTTDPKIASFSPTAAHSGTELTITGSLLGNVTSVTFDAGSPDAVSRGPDSVSATRVVVLIPLDAHPGPISVTENGTSGISTKQLAITEGIYDISPTNVMPGDTVTLTGTGLSGASSVAIGDLNVTPTSVSPTTVTFVVPSNIPYGSSYVTLTATAGKVQPASEIAPVTPVNPLNGSQTNQELDVYGDGFDVVTTVAVPDGAGGTIPADFIYDTHCTHGDCLKVTLPDGAHAGAIVLGDAQGNTVDTTTYSIIAVDSLSEPEWSPGDQVTVTGSGLTGATVKLNGESCVVSGGGTSRSLTFTVPADATSGDLVITTSLGTLDYGPFDESS